MTVNIKHEVSMYIRGGNASVTLDEIDEFVKAAREAGVPSTKPLSVRITNSYSDQRPGEGGSPGAANLIASPLS